MKLIKLSDGSYPYTLTKLKQDNPNVSFPSDLVGVNLADYDAAEVVTDPAPQYNSSLETIETLSPQEIDGVWRVQWQKRQLTAEEIKQRTPADWTGFNSYMLSDPLFKTYRDVVRAVDGDLNSALFNSYSLIIGNGTEAFSLIWELWCIAAAITPQDRETIALKAEDFNLPGKIIDIIRGTNV